MKSSEMNAAFGLVQFERMEEIRAKRDAMFNRYLENLKDISNKLKSANSFSTLQVLHFFFIWYNESL
jgi:dTDP-4-amino-4,6-dideoxygalactose transaminase